jgi:hypothetical protein
MVQEAVSDQLSAVSPTGKVLRVDVHELNADG